MLISVLYASNELGGCVPVIKIVIFFRFVGVPPVAAEGAWAVAYVIFIMFVSLEIPLSVAITASLLFTVSHSLSAIYFADAFRYMQISEILANNLTWLAIGVSGYWIHRRSEGATRKAFLDTRQSIQARLAAHDENDKLGTKRKVELILCLYMRVVWCTNHKSHEIKIGTK